ncbi:MAG: RIP metalloprotease RseP [Flavobacteriales bacterium]|nr:RIP metalloprotease RseP [Flavobacteriales bacterium]MCX7768149.1 RIP metalloprotease RseP [Flavobacteriales bacterium]MDW8409559.1 RIP metalloprotease RseP [Flavobacteriales bacterium]
MEWVVKIGQFLLSLSLLVVLHELGHFVAAHMFGTRVEKFFLFFDYKFALFKKKIGHTVWGIGWIPLGGYVKIAGMVDESLDKAQLAMPPQPWEFRSKKAWQRLIIVLGGIFVNVLLAVVIFIFMAWIYGEAYLPMSELRDGIFVVNEEAGEALGLRHGDKILSIGDRAIDNFGEVNKEILYSGGKNILVERQGQKIILSAPEDIAQVIMRTGIPEVVAPRLPFFIGGFSDSIPFARQAGLQVKDHIIGVNHQTIRYFDEFKSMLPQYAGDSVVIHYVRAGDTLSTTCFVSSSGLIGAILGNLSIQDLHRLGYYSIHTQRYSFMKAIPQGLRMASNMLGEYIRQFRLIFTSEGVKQVGSLGTMLKMFPTTWDWQAFWRLTAFLSLVLAFVNLLPIPALDGGHAMFIIYELITGKKPSDKFLERAQTVGMVLLLILMAYALGNDIFRALRGTLF